MRDITIKGGLFFVPFGKRETCIIGGIRLNDSVINGVFEIVGSRITAAPSGAAVDAIGATIKSDLLFASVHPDRRSTDEVHEGCQIEGVVLITGATLGRLRIVGATLSSDGIRPGGQWRIRQRRHLYRPGAQSCPASSSAPISTVPCA